MKKKILCLLLAVVMTIGSLAVLSSCGDDPGSGGGGGGGGGGGETHSWDSQNATQRAIKFKLTENDNKAELPSGCKRYLAGEENGRQRVDTLVSTRNKNCAKDTNLTVIYDYYDNSNLYTWSNAYPEIMGELKTGKAADMYCNFVYDMVGAMINGCFTNLKSTKDGKNYFEFNKASYNPEKDDKGYMYEYMESLTFSNTKMYLVSSDYFLDVIRAFFVCPVNVKLMQEVFSEAIKKVGLESLGYDEATCLIDGGKVVDLDGDGYSNIDDFFQLIHDGHWNYDILGTFAEAAAEKDASSGDWSVTEGSSVVGFALSASSGLSASGMLYSSGVEILKRENIGGVRTYTYTAPEDTELPTYCQKVQELFRRDGVISVTGDTGLQSIRNAFAEDRVLVGGIVCVGSLEEDVYQSMLDSDGFAVAPPPKYYDEKDYLTQVHNIGRIGAISSATNKFSQCSCFLNYMSTHSSDILEEYYNHNLVAACAYVQGNTEMLQMLRQCITWATDKVFEDAIGLWGASLEGIELWHKVLMSGGDDGEGGTWKPYCIGQNMKAKYNDYYNAKSSSVATMLKDFDKMEV